MVLERRQSESSKNGIAKKSRMKKVGPALVLCGLVAVISTLHGFKPKDSGMQNMQPLLTNDSMISKEYFVDKQGDTVYRGKELAPGTVVCKIKRRHR